MNNSLTTFPPCLVRSVELQKGYFGDRLYLVAYNLVRCLMAQAVAQAGVEMDRLSFKGTVDAVRQYTPAIHRARSKAKRQEICDQLLQTLVRDLVPRRPNRQEPRAVKRRPKAYQLLNKPRHQFREVSHRCRNRKPAGHASR